MYGLDQKSDKDRDCADYGLNITYLSNLTENPEIKDDETYGVETDLYSSI